jgi:hypothetical protein
MIPQKDESWRPCGDYRRLNMITTPDKYPLPNMQDFLNGLDGCSVFSKVNLVKVYHQIPVAPEDIPKMAIITPFGLFEYLFTSFGLSNATQTFQKMIDRTCANLEGTFPYMDDTRVGSPDRETHLHHLDKLFSVLAVNGLAINLEKCVFAVPTLDAAAAAADPVDFEAMAAEQNSFAETQRLLGGTSLKLAFRQAGAHRLAGGVSTSVFVPLSHKNSAKIFS